jgi:hypothetical protein
MNRGCLGDVFFKGLAIVIIFGLTVAAVLTLDSFHSGHTPTFDFEDGE